MRHRHNERPQAHSLPVSCPTPGALLAAMSPLKRTPFYLSWTAIFLLRVDNVSCFNSSYTGCSLEIPSILTHINREPESTPLHLSIDIHIKGLTEVAKSGKYYGIDVEYDLLVHLRSQS